MKKEAVVEYEHVVTIRIKDTDKANTIIRMLRNYSGVTITSIKEETTNVVRSRTCSAKASAAS